MDTIYTEIHAYLENPTEQQREDLIKQTKRQANKTAKGIINKLSWLKDNGLEEALFYNPKKEENRAYTIKEITQEEYLNNPLKAAYEKYVLPLIYEMEDLAYPTAALAALSKLPPFKYTTATEKAVNKAEGLMKKIQAETGIKAGYIASVLDNFIESVCNNSYTIYHPKEWKEFSEKISDIMEQIDIITELIKNPFGDNPSDYYKQQKKDLKIKFVNEASCYHLDVYYPKQAQEETKIKLQRIFPKKNPIIEKIESPIKWENLMPMLQDPFTNELTRLKSDTGFIYDDISERYSKQIKSLGYEIDFKKFIIDEEGNKKPLKIEPGRFLCSIRAKKLLDALMIKLTKEHETIIKLPLNDYLDLFGISKSKPSKDKIRIILKEDLAAINSIGFNYDGDKRTADFKHIAIGANSYGIKNGVIYFEFREEFTNYIKNKNYITQYPIKLFKIDNRNPNAYYLGRKLSYHSSLYNNQKKGTADIIKVKTLLKVCDLISYNQLKKTSGAVTQKIIDPFEKALDSLKEGVLDQWEYCNAKKQPLNDEQLKTLSYDAFIERYIKFTLKDKPKTKEADEIKKRNTNKKPVKSKKSIPLK